MAKRKRASRKISLPGAAPVTPRPAPGRPPKEDATRVVIDARLRIAGKYTQKQAQYWVDVCLKQISQEAAEQQPDKQIIGHLSDIADKIRGELRRDSDAMKSQLQGCAIGRALEARGGHDKADLWRAVEYMRRTYAAYRGAHGLPSPHAIVARILSPTDAVETSAEAPPADLRTDEERARAATTAYARLIGWLGYTDTASRAEAWRVVIVEPAADLAPIGDLPAIIRALQCVVDGMVGNRMVWRGATTG